MRLSIIYEKKGHCPSCGKKFKKDEPYPDVENCEVCERFGPPVKESYEGLEDADEFGGVCSICGDTGHAFTCPNCDDEICDSCHQNPENAHCVDCGSTICTGCDTREDPDAGMVCDPCWDRQQERNIEQAYEDAWESNQSDLYEDAYDGLEDADKFQDHETEPCEWCGANTPINTQVDTDLYEEYEAVAFKKWPHGFHPPWFCCNDCLKASTQSLKKELGIQESYEGLEDADQFEDYHCSNPACDSTEEIEICARCGSMWCESCVIRRLEDFGIMQRDDPNYEPGMLLSCPNCEIVNESTYEGLEDADEFEDDRGYDPIWDEFTYRFLGSKSGHEFTFRGNTYHVYTGWGRDGRDVEKDGEVIGNARDEVPWEEFEYNAVGEHLPAQRWTWYELVEQLYNMYGPEDYGDPPPGVGV